MRISTWFFLLFTLSLTMAVSVPGLFKIESPLGAPIAGMKLTVPAYPNSTGNITDEKGRATLFLPANQDFVVRITKPPHYQDLWIFGKTEAASFNYTTFMGTRAEAKVLALLDRSIYDASRGYIVAGMDVLRDPAAGLAPSNLVAAVGATAVVDGLNGSAPFIFEGLSPFPVRSSTLTSKSSSFVTYPNVIPGVGKASTQPPPGAHCAVSPAYRSETWTQQIQVYPDSVSVISFVCINSTMNV